MSQQDSVDKQLASSILYEDDHLLVTNKKPWCLSVPGKDPHTISWFESIQNLVQQPIYVVHRLDCATSGIMLFAKTAKAQQQLHKEFRNRRVSKLYYAITRKPLPDTQGTIDLPLMCDWPLRPKQKVCLSQGKAALTHWQHLSTENGLSLVKLKPITGRTHQLRVHMAAIGCPLLGDKLYAGPEDQNQRLFLHAGAIFFRHPASGASVGFRCPHHFESWIHQKTQEIA